MRCAALAAACGSLAIGTPARAKIQQVVVYADKAQVTHVVNADCAAGSAVFGGLPSTLDPRTLAADLRGGSGEVVGLTHTTEASGPRARAKALQDQIHALDLKLVQAAGEVEASRATERKLSALQEHLRKTWGRQAIESKPPTATWDQALDLLRQRALAAAASRRAATQTQRELQRERQQLALELSQQQRSRRRTTFTVSVLLRCTGHGSVRLSYVVPDATWRVSYQLRTRGNGAHGELIARAIVQQGTGEDWRDVKLAVSTANLSRNNTPPTIQRMRVSSHEPRSTRKVLSKRFEKREHLRAASPGGAAVASQTIVGGKQQQARPATEEGLALQLPAAERATVPADGRQIVVRLASRQLALTRVLETVPKLYPYVYRKVELHNPFSHLMLPGPIGIVRGNTFIGRARVEKLAPGEPFSLSLGVDNQLQVKRYVKREQLEGGSAFGTSKKLHHRYVIELGNWTAAPQTITVRENIPVTQVQDISVALAGDSTKPTDWDKQDGIVSWKVRVPPRTKRKVVLGYSVALPKSWAVSGY